MRHFYLPLIFIAYYRRVKTSKNCTNLNQFQYVPNSSKNAVFRREVSFIHFCHSFCSVRRQLWQTEVYASPVFSDNCYILLFRQQLMQLMQHFFGLATVLRNKNRKSCKNCPWLTTTTIITETHFFSSSYVACFYDLVECFYIFPFMEKSV